MTKNVEKATQRRFRLPAAARSRHDADARVPEPSPDSAARSPRASTDLRLPWRHDGLDAPGELDRSAATGGVDSGQDAARHHHARRGVDAHALRQAAAAAPLAELLRRERLAAAPRVDPSRLYVPRAAKTGAIAGESH